RHSCQPCIALDSDRAARNSSRPHGLYRAAHHAGPLHGFGIHVDARLSWRRVQRHGAFAAYITGNVASNLVGRLIAAAVVDHFGLASNFYFFAAINLAGAVLVYYTVAHTTPMAHAGISSASPFAAWIEHPRDPRLRAAFGVGFCILFAFIGTFTF